jgi:hypothetical protein
MVSWLHAAIVTTNMYRVFTGQKGKRNLDLQTSVKMASKRRLEARPWSKCRSACGKGVTVLSTAGLHRLFAGRQGWWWELMRWEELTAWVNPETSTALIDDS